MFPNLCRSMEPLLGCVVCLRSSLAASFPSSKSLKYMRHSSERQRSSIIAGLNRVKVVDVIDGSSRNGSPSDTMVFDGQRRHRVCAHRVE
ncbi:hypothetical protein FPV67DRAFT_786671 [Lyophyllum atratum]|nr:hypothetical protein FPV67DRAFT_786671 [Lyophyllum atratum]